MTVIDVSQQLPGPYASGLLAQLGAEVTKVEPLTGDPSRRIDPAMFEIANQGKECVWLNLKSTEGVDRLHNMVRHADVFLEGFRPGVAARLGAGYGALAEVRPDLVYCSISGAGQQGPFANVPMHDLNLQALAGGDPAPGIGVPWVDLGTGTVAALAIVAAWHQAQETGRGACLDAAMLDTAVVWNRVKASARGRTEPTYGLFATKDDHRVAVAILEDHIWQRLCAALGWDAWAADETLATYDQRVASAEEIQQRLTAACAALTLEEVMTLTRDHDLSITPVDDGSVAQVLDQFDLRSLKGSVLRLPLPVPASDGARS